MKNKKIIYVIVVIILISIIGVLGYLYINEKNKNEDLNKKEENVHDKNEISSGYVLTEEEALTLAKEKYEYGISALIFGNFHYDHIEYIVEDGEYYFKIYNYEEIENSFTKDNQVKTIRSGEYHNYFDFVIMKNENYYGAEWNLGANQEYRNTELNVAEITEDEIVIDAVSYYCKDEMGIDVGGEANYNCETETITDKFILKKEDNMWKIDKMINPRT